MINLDELKAQAPQAAEYLTKAGAAISSASMAFDYARAAEKMVDPNCSGAENPAWQKGPIITTAPGIQDYNRNTPSVLQGSLESSVANHMVHGEAEEEDAIHLPQSNSKHNQVEHIIAKLAIIEQFTLLQNFLSTVDDWEHRVPTETSNLIIQIGERQDELLNDANCEEADMREAIDIFSAAVQSAAEIKQ